MEKLEVDFLSLKTESLKLRENQNNFKTIQDENNKLREEIDKFKVLNQDRIGLLSELEEKNNLIFDLKNEIRNLEHEIESIARTESFLKDKNKELNSNFENSETKLKEMRTHLLQAEKEKEELASSYQKKLEIIQIKLFNKSDSEDASSESNLSQLSKVIEIFNDSLTELKSQFASKISNLQNTFSEIKEKCLKSESSIMSIINEKNVEILDVIKKVRSVLEEDINKARFRLSAENKSKTSDIIEWYKKQVQELQPYKNKFNALDAQFKIMENANKQLSIRIADLEMRLVTGEKLEVLCKEKILELQRKIEDLEAKLCDIKHFVYNNLNGDLLDEFNSYYNNQTIK
jgi:chromosome segregation ATPase